MFSLVCVACTQPSSQVGFVAGVSATQQFQRATSPHQLGTRTHTCCTVNLLVGLMGLPCLSSVPWKPPARHNTSKHVTSRVGVSGPPRAIATGKETHAHAAHSQGNESSPYCLSTPFLSQKL